jgi:hypothetical protein
MQPKLGLTKWYGPTHGMRVGTKVQTWPLNFILNRGGMGDFLNYSAALTWLARNSSWIEGRVHVPRYLVPLMQDVFKPHPTWRVYASEDKRLEPGTSWLGPSVEINGVDVSRQYLTPTGAHPIDVAFAYYVGACPAPTDALLPVLDYYVDTIPEELVKVCGLKTNYAVVPTGFSAESRRVLGRHLNPVIRHLKKRGLMPVFLGKNDLLGDGKQITSFPDDIDYAAGVDLRGKTDVKQAAMLMQHAALTIGLDNGLLHLAALMKDSKIIFGYNITTIEHRVPRRNHGKTISLAVTEADLPCAPCQSKWKNVPVHKFTKCFYGDSKCVDLLFKDDAIRWREAIDQMLEAENG